MRIYASYYVNQTCDEIEIGIVGKWKFSSFERCNFCFHTMYSKISKLAILPRITD
jgi:hypothetical protein